MSLQETFILNLKKHRKQRGISQMALAELCDSSANYIGEIEMGRRIPSFEKIEKIAAALGIAPPELFCALPRESAAEEFSPERVLMCLPRPAKKEIARRLLAALSAEIDSVLNAGD
ncbi:MAG: helix-turn-helix domain-containing protein [Spirochaetaceae bacterium]|nr:helix-turn-helix domain-containing protein [Spirochaetaceae bacterium]